MSDPWALTIASLALLGQLPNFLENWEKIINKLRAHKDLSETELDASEITLLEARADWLVHKILLLDLVLAFAEEHVINSQLVNYCESQRPLVFEEFKKIKDRIIKITPKKL